MRKIVNKLIIAIVVTSCSQKNNETIQEKVIPVTVANVSQQKDNFGLKYSGSVEAFQSIPLTFQSNGIVESVLADAGDEVKKGQLLATIDKADFENLYKINEVKYKQAEDAYNRLKSVHEQGSLTEIKWIEMETNYQQAKSSLEISKNNLDKCYLRAPSSGIIGRRNIEPGMSSISLTNAPFELVEIKSVYIKISVPENEISRINKGLKAVFHVGALNNKSFEGEITNVSPVADIISRTYTAKILVKNTNLELKPGMVCDVVIDLPSQKQALIVPYESVTTGNNGETYVFVVDIVKKRVRKQVVEIGNYIGNNLEILSGLIEGDVVVKEGKEKLSDNSLISL